MVRIAEQKVARALRLAGNDALWDALLRPRSIAFVGASEDVSKVGGRAFHHLLEKGFAGRVYPVHPRHATVCGIDAVNALDQLPHGIDLGIVAVAAAKVPEVLTGLGQAGVRMAVVFSSGLGELGEEGAELEAQCLQAARRHQMRLLGPNSLGFVNGFENVCPSFSQFVEGDLAPGPIAFVTQSGAFGTAIAALARRQGLGIGYFIHTGNESDIGFSDVMQQVISDPRIRVGAAYLESVRDGPSFVALAQQALDLGKPLVVAKAGRTASGARAAASHTGALATDDAIFSAVVRQFGVIRASHERHLLNIVNLIVDCSLPSGSGLGIVTQSGGAGVLLADKAEELGLHVPALSDRTQRELRSVLPAFAALANPVDVTAAFIGAPEMLSQSVEHVLNDPQVAVGVVWLQLMERHVDKLVAAISAIREQTEKPFAVVWVAAPDRALQMLRARGIVVFQNGDEALEAIAALVHYVRDRERARSAALHSAPATVRPEGGEPLCAQHHAVPTMDGARLLRRWGVNCVQTALAASPKEAAAAAAAMGFPVALKVESSEILHKSDIGGVRLNLADADVVESVCRELMQNMASRCPGARVEGILVQKMAPRGVEMVVGLKRDPTFGMMLMLGVGGVFVEVLKDVAFRKAPVSPGDVESMIEELRGAALLEGARGAAPVDKEALIELACAVSRMGAAGDPAIRELDINPVICGPEGAVAVDWLMTLE